jgi:hypothetical protein
MKGCIFPGNTISWEGAERWGETTDTDGSAICAVSALTVAPCLARVNTPYAKIPMNRRRMAAASSQPRFDPGRTPATLTVGGSGGTTLPCASTGIAMTIPISFEDGSYC